MSARRYWIGFNKVRGIGPAKLRALLDQFGDIESAWKGSRTGFAEAGLDRRSIQALEAAQSGMDLDLLEAEVERSGFQTLCWDDEDYPRRLRETDSPPPLIFLKGALAPSDDWAVAIVGTRRATPYGRDVAHELATQFAAGHWPCWGQGSTGFIHPRMQAWPTG